MYLVGIVNYKRVINTEGFYLFCLANKQTITDSKIKEIQGNKAIWKVTSRKTDKHGDPFLICDFVRVLTEEECSLVEMRVINHIMHDGRVELRRVADVFYTFENFEEYLKKDGTISPVGAVPHQDLARKNLKLWQDYFINQKCSIQCLLNVLSLSEIISMNTLELCAPTQLPCILSGSYCGRDGVVKTYGPHPNYGYYYLFHQQDGREIIALTKEELLKSADKFNIPIKLTLSKNGFDVIASLDLSKNKSIEPRAVQYHSTSVECAIEDRNCYTSMSLSWIRQHMNLFPLFEIVGEYFLPKEDLPFELHHVISGRKELPGSIVEIYFPDIKYTVHLPLVYIYSKLRGECLNGELYREGTTPETLRIIFEENDSESKTSIFN